MKKSKKKTTFADEVVKQLENLPDEPFIDLETGKEVTLDEIFGEGDTEVKKMDRWVEKMLLGDPTVKLYPKRPYPYRNYNKIDDLLRVHGKELIDRLVNICPLFKKQYKLEHQETLIDSLAWIIWTKRIDPKSLMPTIPEYKNYWDKFSESGYDAD